MCVGGTGDGGMGPPQIHSDHNPNPLISMHEAANISNRKRNNVPLVRLQHTLCDCVLNLIISRLQVRILQRGSDVLLQGTDFNE